MLQFNKYSKNRRQAFLHNIVLNRVIHKDPLEVVQKAYA